MIEINEGEHAHKHHHETLVLHVRYAPAKAPYIKEHASVHITLSEVKTDALHHFHLKEGSVDGGSKTYQITFDDVVQTNLSLTLGELAGHKKHVELLLIEQFVQG